MKHLFCMYLLIFNIIAIATPNTKQFSSNIDVWNGNVYHITSAPQYETTRKNLRNIQFKGDEHILDIGCGSGEATADMAQAVPQGLVIGIDASPSMINFAQKNYRTPHCMFELISAQDFVFPAASFNYVTSFSCLHWIKDLKTVLKKIAHVLKPNGKFIGNMAHKNHFFYEPVMTTVQSEKWRNYFTNFQEEPWYAQEATTLGILLNEVGLKPISITQEGTITSFTSKKQFAAFIRNWIYAITHMAVLPKEKQEEFIDDTIEYFLQNNVQFAADGSFSFFNKHSRFSFEAIKE